ncbi:hypothetical protein [Silanimonas sp.]|jgi:hypothetical protein|uniref:hypothetical protein n=1 Tax=Silanimonas sp. TaxID=1929290 RepID=UPI0022BBAAAF|nr:hypothetical protein [Silanimonas sp.]MCZ8061444.1 hypothetical protein [Silanimonas sp.]
MREVYRSLRVEQVEGAATLLNEAGIETSIQNGRSYKGGRRRNFSFRETPDSAKAAVLYVTHNGDLPEARRLLREAGLMEPGQRESYLPQELQFQLREEKKPRIDPRRLRTVLLMMIVIIIALFTFFGPYLAR